MMNKGWKPLPVILKIIFVILTFRVFNSFFSLSFSFEQGFDFFGFTFYGLYAVNVFTVFKILVPIIILFEMFQRNSYTWIVAAIYFFLFSISTLLSLMNMTDMVERIMEQMPEMFQVPPGLDENDYLAIIKIAFTFSIVFSAAFELAIMIIFIVKRKYFSEYISDKKSLPENNLPS
jgi:hypothetical protein